MAEGPLWSGEKGENTVREREEEKHKNTTQTLIEFIDEGLSLCLGVVAPQLLCGWSHKWRGKKSVGGEGPCKGVLTLVLIVIVRTAQ